MEYLKDLIKNNLINHVHLEVNKINLDNMVILMLHLVDMIELKDHHMIELLNLRDLLKFKDEVLPIKIDNLKDYKIGRLKDLKIETGHLRDRLIEYHMIDSQYHIMIDYLKVMEDKREVLMRDHLKDNLKDFKRDMKDLLLIDNLKDLLLIKGLKLDLMDLKDKFPLKVMLGHHLLDLKDHLLDLKDHLKVLKGHLKDLKDNLLLDSKDHLKDLKGLLLLDMKDLLLDSKDLQLDSKDLLKLDMRDHHQDMTDHHQDMKDHHQDMRGHMVMRDLLLHMRGHLLDMMIDKDHSQHIHKFLKQTHIDCHKKVEHMRDGHILHKHNEDSYLMILLVHKHKE